MIAFIRPSTLCTLIIFATASCSKFFILSCIFYQLGIFMYVKKNYAFGYYNSCITVVCFQCNQFLLLIMALCGLSLMVFSHRKLRNDNLTFLLKFATLAVYGYPPPLFLLRTF